MRILPFYEKPWSGLPRRQHVWDMSAYLSSLQDLVAVFFSGQKGNIFPWEVHFCKEENLNYMILKDI